MISKKYIKTLEFETIYDLYEYVVESKINGAHSQVKELIKKLSKEQFTGFLDYLGPENENINYYVHRRFDK